MHIKFRDLPAYSIISSDILLLAGVPDQGIFRAIREILHQDILILHPPVYQDIVMADSYDKDYL